MGKVLFDLGSFFSTSSAARLTPRTWPELACCGCALVVCGGVCKLTLDRYRWPNQGWCLRPSSDDFPQLAVKSSPGQIRVRESERLVDEKVTTRTEEYVDPMTGESRLRTVEIVEKLIEKEVGVTWPLSSPVSCPGCRFTCILLFVSLSCMFLLDIYLFYACSPPSSLYILFEARRNLQVIHLERVNF